MPSSGQTLDRAFAIIGTISALLGAVAIAALIFVAREADVAEQSYEASLIQRGVQFRIQELEKELQPHVIWDEAMINVDQSFDAEWTTKNIGLPVIIGYGHHSLYILSGEGRPIYGIEGRDVISAEKYRSFSDLAAPLIAKLRREETQWRLRGGIPPPLRASIASEVGRQRIFLTASVLQGDFEAKPKGRYAPILITVLPLEKAFAEVLGVRYALENARIVRQPLPDWAHAALPTGSRGTKLFLEWPPRAPGSALLKYASSPLMVLLITLALIFLAVVRASRKVVTQLTDMAAEARWRALHDPLTGLGNRAYLSIVLQRAVDAVAAGHPFAALLVDLDHFKAINDTWGHEVGDEIIVNTSEMLISAAGPEAEVARLGGDEFVVVLPNADLASTEQVCAQILARCGSVCISTGGLQQISCTIGAALIHDTGVDAAEALRRADQALYHTKATGRGRVTFAFNEQMSRASEEMRLKPIRRGTRRSPELISGVASG